MIIANQLYTALETDFNIQSCRDDYWSIMDFSEYFTESFKQRYIGLLMDSTDMIEKVYTAVFPSDYVINQILRANRQNALLLLHHPMKWEIPNFQNIDRQVLGELKKNHISIYILHAPLDKNGKYSTTVSLARNLDITPKKGFYDCLGLKVGVIGKTPCANIIDLAQKVKETVKHEVKLYQYGADNILNNKVALIAGGGNNVTAVREIIALGGINTFITGISNINLYTRKAHSLMRENKINLIGATHYSTEKFGCMAMVDYFQKLGIEAEFVEDFPGLGDL